MDKHYCYVTMAFAQIANGQSEGFLTEGHHHDLLEKKYSEGYRYVGWVPVTYGFQYQIKEVELIFEKIAKEEN